MERDELIKVAFKKIKEEMDDHLQSINENTNEIQANYEYLEKLEAKIDKLNEKIEELTLNLQGPSQNQEKAEEFKDITLTIREQEVFLVIYTSNDFLSYYEISRRLGLTPALVSNYVTNLIEKGIPIVKRYINRMAEVQLEPWFKELQAKENILEIDSRVAREYIV